MTRYEDIRHLAISVLLIEYKCIKIVVKSVFNFDFIPFVSYVLFFVGFWGAQTKYRCVLNYDHNMLAFVVHVRVLVFFQIPRCFIVS